MIRPEPQAARLSHLCGLSIEDKVPDHSAFSHARNERFRDSDIFRIVFERVVGACIGAGTMIKRTEQRFDIKPERLAGDTAYGSGANLNWLVNEAKIAPHSTAGSKSVLCITGERSAAVESDNPMPGSGW